MSNDELERERQYHYELGISSGLDSAAQILLIEATVRFQAGDDANAQQLRRISDVLKQRAKDAHPNKGEKK